MLPAVQNKLKDLAATTLMDQVDASVTIGQFRLGFPITLEVNDILIEKGKQDTLFFLQHPGQTQRQK